MRRKVKYIVSLGLVLATIAQVGVCGNTYGVQAATQWSATAYATPTPSQTAVPYQTVLPDVTATPYYTASPYQSADPYATATPDVYELTPEEQQMADEFTEDNVKKLKCTKNVAKKIKLTWEEQENAEIYVIYRSKKENKGYKIIGATKKTHYKDTDSQARNTYYYKVQARMSIAETEYRSEMSNSRKVYAEPKNPLTVMAGECFVEDLVMLKSTRFTSHHRFVYKIGLNTYTMLNNNYFTYNGVTMTAIERVAIYIPDRVYFLIGANESAWTYPDYTMNNFKKAFELLKKVNERVEIILVKIPPFGWTSTQNIPSVEARARFNRRYKKFADNHKRVYFCPATDVLSDGTEHLKSAYDGGDGCHWNMTGANEVAVAIKKWSRENLNNW